MARSKYNAKPTIIDGVRFASRGEARRFEELRLLERGGLIANLTLQPRFPLLVEGIKVGTYVGDFKYEEDGKTIIEDFKGGEATKTPVYRLKARLLYALYKITIREVTA